MHAHEGRSEWDSVYARNEAMKDAFARCHKKTAVQVCTLTIMHSCLISVGINVYDPLVLPSSIQLSIIPILCVYRICIITVICVYFRRLKINHDVHEFILDSGTVANTTHPKKHWPKRWKTMRFKRTIFIIFDE